MAKAFHLRGQCYNQMGDFQRALYDFSLAIRIAKDKKKERENDGDLAKYYNSAGFMHYELAQYDEAQKHYDMAIRTGAEASHYYNSGLCKMALDKIPEAIEDLTKAIG